MLINTKRSLHVFILVGLCAALAACAPATPDVTPGATSGPVQPTAIAAEPQATAGVATAMPTAEPTLAPTAPPTPTPIPQQIIIDSPAPGATIANPFTIAGQVALTPQDGRLVYLIRDSAGAIIGSGTLPVQGQSGGPGTFSAELAYRPSLPGGARVEIIAMDGSAAFDAQIAPVIATLQEGISLNLGGVASAARGRVAERAVAQRDWIDMSGTPKHLQVLFDNDAPAERFTPNQRQLMVLPVADYRKLFKGSEAQLFDQTLQRLRDVLAARPARLDGELALLPASDQSQAFHAQARYIDFPGGSGVRYLTYLTQEIEPFNSTKLVYAFQGLTNDGENLIAAYFPISATLLAPNAASVDQAERDRFKQDYAAYTAQTATALDGDGYQTTPSLAALDALMTSLQISTSPPAAPAAAPGAAGATLTATATEQVNVRAGPGPRFRRIGGLEAREEVDVIGRNANGAWLRIRTSAGLTGWVSSEYVNVSGDVNALPVVE